MNESAFDELVRRHAPSVHAYARAMCRDRHIAEEAVQETFLRAWRYVDSFRGDGSFEGWLLRICRNCIVDLARRAEPELPGDARVLERAMPLDTSGELFSVLGELPLPQREVLLLCGVLGYSYVDAADLLGVPVGTVRSRLSRGRAALEAMLSDSGAARETA